MTQFNLQSGLRVAFFAKQIYYLNRFKLPISRREIAIVVGMSTENVIRAMSEFRKDRILRFNGKKIEIVNEKLLENISDFWWGIFLIL